MRTVTTIDELRGLLDHERLQGRLVGFVPTMGYLHDGHVALIRSSVESNDVTVVSVFVNPLQFGPSEDLDTYPRDIDRDRTIAEAAGAAFVLVPSVYEMYPPGDPKITVDPGPIARLSEGIHRPGHFSGVATVCTKLFGIVGPCRAYFGMKDAQQVAVVRQVVSGLNLPVEVVACPTIREPDGLAMSSRNVYLSDSERRSAAAIPEALKQAAAAVESGERSAEVLRAAISSKLSNVPSVTLQYVDVVDPVSFEPLSEVGGKALITLAAFAGKTRLIDNIEVGHDVGTG